MDNNGQHGCFTLPILSIVICTFVRYKTPLQKAHVICKIINVQNDAKLAHTNVRAIKSTVGYSERSSILTASEKHPPYKVFDYSVNIYFTQYHTPLKTLWIIHQPIMRKKSIPHHACFLTIKAWIQWFVFYKPFSPPLPPTPSPLLSSTRPQVYSKVRLLEHVSYGRVILRTLIATLCAFSYTAQKGKYISRWCGSVGTR